VGEALKIPWPGYNSGSEVEISRKKRRMGGPWGGRKKGETFERSQDGKSKNATHSWGPGRRRKKKVREKTGKSKTK